MTIKKITPEELYQKLATDEKVVVLDVRDEQKYEDYHIEDMNVESLNIHKTKIFELAENEKIEMNSLPKEKEIVVTCTTGNSATKCATILFEHEYDVVILEGGITAWKEYLRTR